MTHEMTHEIIRLDPTDYYECAAVWDMTKNPAQTQKWYDEIVSGNREVFVYTENGAYIAEGALVYDNGDRDYTILGQRVYLSRMIVKTDRRNQGIGGVLLDFLCAEATRQGFTEIALGVDKANKAAWHLYEKKGFDTVLFDGEDEMGKYVKLLKSLVGIK